MKFYISESGIKRVTISSAVASGGGGRRLSHRTVLLAVLMLAIILPFLFVRIAFVVLESATVCSSSLECMRWRFFGKGDSFPNLREELTRALLESNVDEGRGTEIDSWPASFNDLVKDISSNKQDIKAFAFKTKAMMLKMERKIQSARRHEAIYWHLASHGVPKSLHCLCLKLAEEYAVNAMARSRLPSPEFVYRLTDSSFHHVVLLTDNVLAASLVVSSTVKNSANPEKLVFHIVTDKKTYTPMHAWFAVTFISSAVVEVKGLHQYDWSREVNVGVREIMEIHRLIWRHNYNNFKKDNYEYVGGRERDLVVLSPSCLSLMNHLRIYVPELFPDLNKIVFLDDDIVVQHDLSSLWESDLNGKVVGAVVDSWCGHGCCPGRKYKDYFNFTNKVIASNLDHDRCGWLYGMNVFDLQAWRKTNVTTIYHQWLKLNLKSGFQLWRPGALPPALIAFEGHVNPIDPSWHLAGLGYQVPTVAPELTETAAVIHFSGPAKPWLEIGFPEVRRLWKRHVNFSNEFVRKCRIMQ
ncbi:probable galacturonosyltransferase 15 [Actinidia eriantha]|uniref:probable galacturonosyltransferase 15 n=1 Tax=Actinidia eriantha TaxID=165200 RepID=UPI00258F9E7E|nr:probable galacturonosyltransferase 15 [Actinidia eriantha]XP_057474763.1 probable galacturonosyltransferase 15 [Actinidia eriantha]